MKQGFMQANAVMGMVMIKVACMKETDALKKDEMITRSEGTMHTGANVSIYC